MSTAQGAPGGERRRTPPPPQCGPQRSSPYAGAAAAVTTARHRSPGGLHRCNPAASNHRGSDLRPASDERVGGEAGAGVYLIGVATGRHVRLGPGRRHPTGHGRPGKGPARGREVQGRIYDQAAAGLGSVHGGTSRVLTLGPTASPPRQHRRR